MRPNRPQRPSADATRKKILDSATSLFMEHGYHGTSMANLAAKAGVNQTLIFHHFGDKKSLWRQVKENAVAKVNANPISQHPETIEQFLSEVIEQSILVHKQCPQLVKLIAWQRLESGRNKHELAGISSKIYGPNTWLEAIKYLQKQHLLNSKLKPELLILWLVGSIDVMTQDDLGLFKKNPKNKKYYIKMLVACLVNGMSANLI